MQPQLLYIGTSKVKEIRSGGEVTSWQWGSYGAWTKFKNPVADKSTKVTYNKNTKNKVGASKYGGVGGVTKLGTTIPATATRTISGVERTVNVRYYQRGYTIYTRTSALKADKKMKRTTYTKAKPYQYRLQYQDKPVIDKTYSTYADGMEYIFFADYYYNASGTKTARSGHMLHPQKFEVTFSDCRKNFNSSANNSERDNSGSYVLSNVRANIITLDLAWNGLSAEDGEDLLDTLNPVKNTKNQYPYLTVQFINPATGKYTSRTFFASDRKVSRYANGVFEEISVTLTEV